MTPRFLIAFSLCLLTAFTSQGPQSAHAQQTTSTLSSAETPTAPETPNDQVLTHINNLTSPQFTVRQAASAALLKQEESQLPALIAARRSLNGEAAVRLSKLIDTLCTRWFDKHLKTLETTPEKSYAIVFTDWTRFADLVGDEHTAIRLFPEILRAERALFTARQYQPDTLPAVLETRSKAFAESCNGRQDQPFAVATAMALMLIASDTDVRLLRATSSSISGCLDDPRFHTLVEHGVHFALLQRLVSAWIQRPGISPDRPLIFAMQHRLPAGRNVALRVLQAAPRGPRGFYALMCLATLKNAEDLRFIESLLDSKSIVWPLKGTPAVQGTDSPPNTPDYQVQLCDVALITALHLRDAAMSLPDVQAVRSETTLYRLDSLGYQDDVHRRRALDAYRMRFAPTQMPQ
ncbi:MAG: hypothetical protein WCK86_15300 [Planctomycetia bacterium]